MSIHSRPLLKLVSLVAMLLPPFQQSAAQEVESNQYRDWELRCPAGSDATGSAPRTSTGCVLTQPLLLKDGRQLLALQVATVGASADGEDAGQDYALILSAPLGVHLPSGARIQVDDSATLNLVFERCDEGGCYAGTLVSENLHGAMQQGSELTVAIQDLNGREITARMSLLGYTAGMQALRTRDPG